MIKYLQISLFLLISANCISQGIEFYDGNWTDALKLAEESEKLVFVDAYAEWCGPCKMMARTTFKEKSVEDFFNENFINLKIDMEKGQGLEFSKKYPVSAFPTLMFLNGKGELVQKAVGAKQGPALIDLAKQAMSKDDRSGDYEMAYEKGERDFDLVYKYVKALNKVNKPSAKIVNDYLRSSPKITENQLVSFLLAAVTDADSKAFEELLKRKSLAESITDKERVKETIINACKKTVHKAVEYESEMLLTEAQNKMKSSYKSESKAFMYESKMAFYDGMGETALYLETVQDYCKKIIKKDSEALNDLALDIYNGYKKNKEALDLAENIAKNANKNDDSKVDYYITYAKILSVNNKKEEAIKIAYKALDLTKKNKLPTKNIEGLIRYIESS